MVEDLDELEKALDYIVTLLDSNQTQVFQIAELWLEEDFAEEGQGIDPDSWLGLHLAGVCELYVSEFKGFQSLTEVWIILKHLTDLPRNLLIANLLILQH